MDDSDGTCTLIQTPRFTAIPPPVNPPLESREVHEYYMMIFSAQRALNRPKYTHTFATFVKTKGPDAPSEHHLFESHTISWLAAKKKVCLFRLWPERGANLDLTTSLEWALSVQARISMWGPFQIRKAFYDKALVQKARLESGTIQYKVFDPGYRPAVASSCIHGLCDIDRDRGLLWTWLRYGESASQHIAIFFLPWMISPEQTHPWVGDRLGLADYPIIARDLPAKCMQKQVNDPLGPVPAVQVFPS